MKMFSFIKKMFGINDKITEVPMPGLDEEWYFDMDKYQWVIVKKLADDEERYYDSVKNCWAIRKKPLKPKCGGGCHCNKDKEPDNSAIEFSSAPTLPDIELPILFMNITQEQETEATEYNPSPLPVGWSADPVTPTPDVPTYEYNPPPSPPESPPVTYSPPPPPEVTYSPPPYSPPPPDYSPPPSYSPPPPDYSSPPPPPDCSSSGGGSDW
jgi:hypothetical protein